RAAPQGPMEDVPAAPLLPARYWWEEEFTFFPHMIFSPLSEEPKTDISLPHKLLQAKEIKERKKILRENHQNAEVEGAVWLQTVLIPLEEARAEWEKTSGPFHKQRVVEHCGIFRALFKGATFTPWVTQRLECSQEDKHPVLVCCGNMVTVSEVPPAVSYEADKGFLWTWLLPNPGEYKVFVFRTNSPGNAIESGKEICCYSPPFPAVGTGCHCFIFLLLQPDCPVDFSKGVWQTPCHSLKMGTLSTFDFSRKREAAVTPAGLACFQCQWGSSITWVFHQLLGEKCSVWGCGRGPVCGPGHGPYVWRRGSVGELWLWALAWAWHLSGSCSRTGWVQSEPSSIKLTAG
uniref:Uncharacterized protein n=1 Tax=Strix occidentalis caurina TaxID=311401 RepID=A0A8D0ERJ2_STROC